MTRHTSFWGRHLLYSADAKEVEICLIRRLSKAKILLKLFYNLHKIYKS